MARWSILVIGLLAIVVGIVLLAQRQSSFGWFANAPLEDVSFVSMSSTSVTGLVVLGVGLVLVAGWIGFQLALRRHDRDP